MRQGQRKVERPEGETPNIETEVRMILSAVARMEGQWGAHKIAAVLCGAEQQWLVEEGLDELSVYGLLSHLSQLKVIAMLGALEEQGLVRRGPYKTLELTLSGGAVMTSKRSLSAEAMELLQKARSVRGIRRPGERYGDDSPTIAKTVKLLERGLSPAAIARRRDMEPSTIADHLLVLADRGEYFELSDHLDEALLDELRDKAPGWRPGDALTPIREALDEEECDWARLKLHLIEVSRQ